MHSFLLNDLVAVVAGRDGYYAINRRDAFVGRAIEIYGEYGGIECAFLKNLVKDGDHVIEVGANFGSHTVSLAKSVGTQGRVYAFEPQRACYALLQAQIALNQLHNIHAYNEAAGKERGRLWVPATNYGTYGNFGGIALAPNQTAGAEAVDVVTLDERLADCSCALLKIDVEGMEEDVIRGARKLIGRCNPLIYLENDRFDKSDSLITLLLELGYRLWWHMPALFNPDNFFGVIENIYGNGISLNMFCCRDNHPMAAGLTEIKSLNDPHPLKPRPQPKPQPATLSVNYTIKP